MKIVSLQQWNDMKNTIMQTMKITENKGNFFTNISSRNWRQRAFKFKRASLTAVLPELILVDFFEKIEKIFSNNWFLSNWTGNGSNLWNCFWIIIRSVCSYWCSFLLFTKIKPGQKTCRLWTRKYNEWSSRITFSTKFSYEALFCMSHTVWCNFTLLVQWWLQTRR